jgi:hypothetical protein
MILLIRQLATVAGMQSLLVVGTTDPPLLAQRRLYAASVNVRFADYLIGP